MISLAIAQTTTAAAQPNTLMQFLPLIAMVVIFYFLLIRPQQRRAKELKKMLDGLQKGDEVVSAGGLAGRIVQLGDHFCTIEVADKVEVRVQRSAITQLLVKGTLAAMW